MSPRGHACQSCVLADNMRWLKMHSVFSRVDLPACLLKCRELLNHLLKRQNREALFLCWSSCCILISHAHVLHIFFKRWPHLVSWCAFLLTSCAGSGAYGELCHVSFISAQPVRRFWMKETLYFVLKIAWCKSKKNRICKFIFIAHFISCTKTI